jgi:hypothetical protein
MAGSVKLKANSARPAIRNIHLSAFTKRVAPWECGLIVAE